jgi:triosephosphate isomerase (TIM)
MRKKFIAANWKMFTDAITAELLAAAVAKGVGHDDRVTVVLFPPFPYLSRVFQVVKDTPVALGGQNLYPASHGAYTGEVSPAMLVDVGCKYVILGHSERRHVIGETDVFINRKVHAALAAGLKAIVCIGETLDDRQSDRTTAVLGAQLSGSLAGVDAAALANIVLAYEPVWAIGTGHNATPQQAQEAHAFVRQRVGELCGQAAASSLVIQYGGSVKPENAQTLLSQPDVDGALVGGASLKAPDFLAIFRAAVA